MSETEKVYCGYCHRQFEQLSRTAQGRRYCPECGAIKAEDQR